MRWRSETSSARPARRKCASNWRGGERFCHSTNMDAPASGLLTDLLKQVSRSFYLTMRVLPAAIRPQISVAYLLARTTDTVADTQIVPLTERLQALQALRERILGASTGPLNFGELARHQSSPAEWRLLQRIEEPLALLEEFSTEDQHRIREVLAVITAG